MSTDLLVAGVGNIFRTDDGFATEVVAWLQRHARPEWPSWVRLSDFGIGGVHLAYELLDGVDELILVDAMHRAGGRPGEVYVVEPETAEHASDGVVTMDAHDLSPETVLSLVSSLGGVLGRVSVVGCEPLSTLDGLGLTTLIEGRVPVAGRMVCELVATAMAARSGCTEGRTR